MLKTDELKQGCMAHALDDEMTFVLLARDVAAPHAIRIWCEERLRLKRNRPDDHQIIEARICANEMERQRDAIRAKLAEPAPAPKEPAQEPLHQRLFDLVRQQRMELHEAGLISDEEYMELAKDHPAVERLETYDELRKQLAAAEERARQHKVYLDAVAEALHPHKPKDGGWTYLPDQLPGMVTELRERARQWEEAEASVCPEDVGFVEYIKTLEKRLQKAQEDTERLDRVIQTGMWVLQQNGGGWVVLVPGDQGEPDWKEIATGKTAREAVDAARKESQS